MVSNRIIKIDLNKKTKNVVQMVQGDTNRKLTIKVYDSDEPYLVDGVGGGTIHGAVYIEKPDGTTCGYDTLEDDSPAVTGSGNTLTVYFVPQATTAHGWAYMTVSIFDDEGVELNTFGIDLFIDKKATAEISADYWNLKSIEGLTAAVEGLSQQMVRSVNHATADTDGNVTLLPWQLPYNGVIGGQQVGDVEEALDGLARMQAEIISQEIKDALVNAFNHVAWDGVNGQDYIDALELAMRSKLISISAVFNQGSAVIYDTDDLDTLRQYLTVTALYSDTTIRTVTGYTLSGTLTDGTSTITVSYGGKTATFDVVVTGPLYSIPDFAEQTITGKGTAKVSKTNGVFTIKSTYYEVVYIYPDGTVHSSKSDTLWFQTTQGEKLENRTINIDWVNPNSVGATLHVKFARSNATGNLYTSAFDMAANGSGSNGSSEFILEALSSGQNVSCIGLQFLRASGSGAYPSEITASFKIRLVIDGVRYL